MWEIGASSCGYETVSEELLREYQKGGVSVMEISPKYSGISVEECRKILKKFNPAEVKKNAQEMGIELWSFHLPFGASVDPASLDKKVREKAVELNKEIINTVAETGAGVAVIHGSFEPIADCDREESMKFAKESVYLINEEAKKNGVILAVENLPRTCLGKNSAEMKEFLAVDNSIAVCFDVNHLLEESHKDFVEGVGERIVTLHVSDYDFIDERHWLPGRGKIDWKELVDLLKKVNYTGPFMNELGTTFENEREEGKVTFKELYEENKILLEKYL